MDVTLFSKVVLDAQGNFSWQNLFQAFCEIASRQQQPFPGLSHHLFPETTSIDDQQLATSDSSPSRSSFQDDYSPSPQHPFSDPSASSREEQLEAISDDEDDDESTTQTSSSLSLQQSSTPSPMSTPSPSVEHTYQAAPWSKLRQSIASEATHTTPSPTTASTPWKPQSSAAPQSLPEVPNRPIPRAQHRLKLVLDLDNTLLHAIARNKIGNVDIKLNHFLDSEGRPEMYKFVLPQLQTQTYYIKLRPGLRRFLRDVSEYCDLAIHTNATREYADVIISILDPDRSLFGGRVAAREDETAKDHTKNMDRLFGIDDLDVRSLLILDDRTDVWDDAFHPNIIQCGMYEYLDNRKNALIAKYPSTSDSMLPQQLSHTGTTTVTGIPTSSIAAWGPSAFPAPAAGPSLMQTSPFSPQPEDGNGRDEPSPFTDNPLIGLTSEDHTTTADDEDCEDDDLISTSDSDGGVTNCTGNTMGNMSNGIPTQHHVGTNGEYKMDSTMEMTTVKGITLPSKVEALVDYDMQLDHIRELVISIAEEYNQLKSSHNGEEASVARIIINRRRQILRDVVVQTVGMYKSESMHPEHGWRDNGPQHRRRLVALGAHVAETTIPELTHVLAMRITATIDRVKKERGEQVKYVHALWLNACELTWSRMSEEWFEATSLLNRYHNLPPRKPWVDAWRIIVVNDGKPFDRIQQTISAFSETMDLGGTLNTREHLVTGAHSHGAKVWSPTEHIILKYDQIESNRLFLALQSETISTAYASSKPNVLNALNTNNSTHGTNATPGPGSTQRSTRGRTETRWCHDDGDSSMDDMGTRSAWGPRRKRQRQDDYVNDWSMDRPRSGRYSNRRWRPSWSDSNNDDSSRHDHQDDTPPPSDNHSPSPWSTSRNNSYNNNATTNHRPWNNSNNTNSAPSARRNNNSHTNNDFHDEWGSPSIKQDNQSPPSQFPSSSDTTSFTNQSMFFNRAIPSSKV